MKKKLSIVLVMFVAFMLTIYITCTTSAIDVSAAGVSVVMNGTTLETGYYHYEYDSNGVLVLIHDAENAPAAEPYVYYDAAEGSMTVYGNFDIRMDKPNVPGLQIENGTLILSGAGSLNIVDNGIAGNGAEAIVSTTGAGIVTDAYTGNITLRAINYSAVKGLSTVDLETSGYINISTNFPAGIVVDAGNVKLVGEKVSLGDDSSQAVGLIKAAGDISIVSDEDILADTYTYTGAMFEGNNISLESKYKSVYFYGAKNIANGNLTVTATTGVKLYSNGNVVNGSLTINSDDSIDIDIYSSTGSAVTGDFNVNAENADVNVEAVLYTIGGNIDIIAKSAELTSNSDYVCGGNLDVCVSVELDITGNNDAIKGYANIINNGNDVNIKSINGTAVGGNLDIESKYMTITAGKVVVKGNLSITDAVDVEIKSDTDSVCLGDVNIDASKNMVLYGGGEASVVRGSLTVNPDADINAVVRMNNGNNVPATPILANLPSLGVIWLEDQDVNTHNSNTAYIYIDGVLYDALNPDASSCEHPLVDDTGMCFVCQTYNLGVAELVKSDGTKITYTSLADAVSAAADGDTVKLLHNCNASSLYLDHNTVLRNKKITLDLSGYKLQIGKIDTENALTIMNGTFSGEINHGANTGELTFKDVTGTIKWLQWMPDAGVSLINSQLTFSGTQFWLEKLNMDEQSVFDIRITSGSGLSNYGNISGIEDALGGIKEFLPYGYTIAKKRPFPGARDIRNTILDENGDIANYILLKYKRVTDGEFTVALNPAAYVYDGTSKTPEVIVSYNGTTLTKDVHYTVTYLNNVNAGQAAAKIQGIGVYHDSVDKSFTIDKAPQNAPTGIMAVSETEDGKNDGSIIYVTAAMEYSVDQTSYTAISGNSINGLADGDYYIRYKETANYYASPATKITVHKGKTVTTDNTGNTEATTSTSQGSDNTSSNNQTTGNQNVDGVKTGDSFPIGICLLLMMMSGCSMFIVYRELKKNR